MYNVSPLVSVHQPTDKPDSKNFGQVCWYQISIRSNITASFLPSVFQVIKFHVLSLVLVSFHSTCAGGEQPGNEATQHLVPNHSIVALIYHMTISTETAHLGTSTYVTILTISSARIPLRFCECMRACQLNPTSWYGLSCSSS